MKTPPPPPTKKTVRRCPWVALNDPLYVDYHDHEWGRPAHDDQHFFELLILEGAQAGLSWQTILKRRENYRRAYRGFDPAKVARFTSDKQKKLLKDAGLIRHAGKIRASVNNAKCFLEIQREFGSFDAYVWRFVGGAPLKHRRRWLKDYPSSTPESEVLAKDLKARGFQFVGKTIIYAFMQATGLVNDHSVDCFLSR